MTQTFIRKSLELTADQWRELERLAESVEAHAPTGSTAGQPSWRTLIRLLADGQITISKKENHNESIRD